MMKKIFFTVTMAVSLVFIEQVLAQETIPEFSSDNTQPVFRSQNKISLDIKGMDIVDVLKMLAMRSGVNIVVGKNVTGKVTVFLKDVDIQDAFEIILSANDLAYEKKGDIINVMTQRDYELIYGERYKAKTGVRLIPLKYAKAADLSRTLTQIKTNIGKVVVDETSNVIILMDTPDKLNEMADFIRQMDLPVQTRSFSLNYAQADKLSAKLQETLTKGIGSIKIDERTNKIMVTDYPHKLDEVAKIIDAFDEKTSQVLIDAQIIEIKPSDKFEMGVDWDFFIKRHFQIKSALPIGAANRLLLGTTSVTPTAPGDFKAILDILRTIGDTKILSSPRIMALNNQEAKILVGTKDAYITSTTSQSGAGTTVVSQSVNFVDVGIKLYVTPTINYEGFITMKIRPEISSAERTNITSEGQVTQIPIVTTSEAETAVMLRDGVTIIIGGLKKEQRTKTVKKIPLLGDIPGVGFFFRSTSDDFQKTELVILLTPHIMSGESSLADFSEIKPKDGLVAKMIKGNIITERVTETSVDKYSKETGAEYYKLVADKARGLALFDRPKNEKGEVKLSFVLSREGTLIDEPSIFEADNPALIPYAKKAIKDASPFPPFPKALNKEKETFKINLSYE